MQCKSRGRHSGPAHGSYVTAVKGLEIAKILAREKGEDISCTASSHFIFLLGCQDVLQCSYLVPLAAQGRKPFKPEFQNTLESFEQEKQGRVRFQGAKS